MSEKLEEPFMDMWPVNEYSYKERKEEVTIYSYVQVLEDVLERNDCCPLCEEDKCKGQCMNEDVYPNEKALNSSNIPINKIKDIPLENMTLQSIIDMLPDGVGPSEVKMSMFSHDWGGIPYNKISFYYEKTFPADMEKFKKDKEIYDKKYKEYEKKKAEYDRALLEEELKATQDKLQKLKEKI